MDSNSDPWLTLIQTLQKVLENNESLHLEVILKMIRKNLIFENPGLMPAKILNDSERIRIEGCHLWLFNQLIFFLTEEKFIKSDVNNILLQKDLLSGNLMSQPILFEKMVRKYIMIVEQLCRTELPLREPIVIDYICLKNFDISQIDSSCVFRRIDISTEAIYSKLAECTIDILTYAGDLLADFQQDLMMECFKAALNAFLKLNVSVKIRCLKLFKNQMAFYPKSHEKQIFLLVNVLQGIKLILENIRLWYLSKNISEKELTALSETIVDFMKEATMIRLETMSYESTTLSRLTDVLIEVVTLTCNEPAEGQSVISHTIFEAAVLLAAKIMDNSVCLSQFAGNQLEKMIDKIGYFPKLVFLYKKKIWSDLQNETHIHPCKRKTLNRLCESINPDQLKTENIFLIENTLHICEGLFHKAAKERLKLTAKELWSETYVSFIKRTFYNVDKVNLNFEYFLALMKIARHLLNNIVEDFDPQLISMLVAILLSPFHKKIKVQCLPSNITDFLDSSETNLLYSIQMISIDLLSTVSQTYIKSELIVEIIGILRSVNDPDVYNLTTSIYLNFLVSQVLSPAQVLNEIFMKNIFLSGTHKVISSALRKLICFLSGKAIVYRTESEKKLRLALFCTKCDREEILFDLGPEERNEDALRTALLKHMNAELIVHNLPDQTYLLASPMARFVQLFSSEDEIVRQNMVETIPPLFDHLNGDALLVKTAIWVPLLKDDCIEVRLRMSNIIGAIVECLFTSKISEETRSTIIQQCLKSFLLSLNNALATQNHRLQTSVVRLILKFGSCPEIDEKTLLQCFRMMILCLIRTESCVAREASLAAVEMCHYHGITPQTILNWNKQNLLKLVVSLCVSIYLRNGVPLYKSLSDVSKMLGYNGALGFLSKHYKLFFAILLPWCISHPTCKSLLANMCSIIQIDISDGCKRSFLSIYPYLYINETTMVKDKCIEFIEIHTCCKLYDLLQSNIKRTIAEVLIYYHKSSEYVLHVFKNFLSNSEANFNHTKMTECISKRFLGVLTFFETYLIDPENEKELKRETLLSLGEIIRFMGTKHITPFRFKILAMLRTAFTIDEPNLKEQCTKVWKIFIHTVDIQSLGLLLNTIIVSLEPLIAFYPAEVNDILRYLVISNGNLLSLHISDIFFLDDTHVANDIKAHVRRFTEKSSTNFVDKLQSLLQHINHENLEVRTYGLKYLTKLIAQNRSQINNLLISQDSTNLVLESLLENLMVACKHTDEQLQSASGQCLAELGAIEPSHIPPNYSPQQEFALSINTDSFAIMALAELCRAYQFQKYTKYVDSFSLAIQEILLARGVCPKTNRKMNVWQAIPERMRQLMEPLLTSCYTGLPEASNTKVHPIFGSSKCQRASDWAFLWASTMIDRITDADTQHLLSSLKPSIKHDMHTLSIFLPYIVVHSLQSSDQEDRIKIIEELQCVFNSVAEMQNGGSRKHNQRLRGLKTLQFVPCEALIGTDTVENAADFSTKCAKLAFNQLDFMQRWLCQWRKVHTVHDTNYPIVAEFMKQFDARIIAQANFNCGEYARALMYLESYIEESPGERLQSELSFLAEIYAELLDSDSMEGVFSLKTSELTLKEQILANNLTGRLQESAACFERMMQMKELAANEMRDVVQCYLGLDQPEIALLVSDTFLSKINDKTNELMIQESRAEPLWRLSRFDDLETLIKQPIIVESHSWGVRCGKILLEFQRGESKEIRRQIEITRHSVLNMLRTSGIEQNAYQKGYPLVMKLHVVAEFEKVEAAVSAMVRLESVPAALKIVRDLFEDFALRLDLLQPTARVVEPVLCLRRLMLNELKTLIVRHFPNNKTFNTSIADAVDAQIGELWLKSTELARKSGLVQQANLYILNAESCAPRELFLEKAKLFWQKGEQVGALKLLERGLSKICESGDMATIKKLPSYDRKLYANAKLLIAQFSADSMNIAAEKNLAYFKEAQQAYPESERSLVFLARYLDRIYAAMSEAEQSLRGQTALVDIIKIYGKSMTFGCRYIYESMPRLLTIWLDFTATPTKDDTFRRIASTMNNLVEKFSETLPSFIFFTAFSQLVSRICHPSAEVFAVLKTILVKLINDFPQQSLWMILSVYKSSYSSRIKRCTEVFTDKRLCVGNIQTLIKDFNALAEKLIELTNKDIPPSVKLPTVSSLVKSLPVLFESGNFSHIVIPTQQHMQPQMPRASDRDRLPSQHNAFPQTLVHIHGIKEAVTVLPSLQRPRRITLLGNDGRDYIVMMKPKDDLRKDFRLMEFNAVVKQFLFQDIEARQRRLTIRTYAVLPLNEECGIIEWVPHLQTLRQIVLSIYKEHGTSMSLRELKGLACSVHDTIAKKRDVFVNHLLPRHKPVLAEWFKHQFVTPHNWYQARSSYIRTAAVMSMAGYILGLGDRHGENILFDATNGDTVHVDFNCLFNKGEAFDFPEVVPFRLTQNMVHAMGPVGVEGLYRRCCEITMRVLQSQTSTLMSVLRPFVYDPLVGWNRRHEKSETERTDSQAMENIKHIEARLKGHVQMNGKLSHMALSTEGQVNFLIDEATSIDNLARMYIGWGAYI